MSDEARSRLEVEARQQKQAVRLRADVSTLRADVERLSGERDALVHALREQKMQRETEQRRRRADGREDGTAKRAEAPGVRRSSPKTSARPLQANNAAIGQLAGVGKAKLALAAGGTKAKLDPEERQRLEALKAKYGEGVAERAAQKVAGPGGQPGRGAP